MAESAEQWRPGSFTKNFSWGGAPGLSRLHTAIRLGFGDELTDVPRALFVERMKPSGLGHYVPLNFFLFNRVESGVSLVSVDELVFQALNFPHSSRFDKLALFAFNFSYVGNWTNARDGQDRPAKWALSYITERVANELNWKTSGANADDIERYLQNDSRFIARTSHRKVATNLNYIYQRGQLKDFANPRVERWWVDAIFLALDRLVLDRARRGVQISEDRYGDYLNSSGFHYASGKRSIEKDLATKHLIALYRACGSLDRFSDEQVEERTKVLIPDINWFLANDPRPRGAIHPTNPRVLKAIPRACAMLAKYAGFEMLNPDELEELDAAEFIKKQTISALAKLSEQGIMPTMTAEEVMRMTRGKHDNGEDV